jgi:hypothetical protein
VGHACRGLSKNRAVLQSELDDKTFGVLLEGVGEPPTTMFPLRLESANFVGFGALTAFGGFD